MSTSLAVVFEGPEALAVRPLPLLTQADDEVVVDVEWSAISTGTERLLYRGEMPPFPGLGYPLVPGYETVGRVVEPGGADVKVGDRVFVPGANCYGDDVRGLFGGAASRLRIPPAKAIRIEEGLAEQGVMLALGATAEHAIASGEHLPELIVGHGALGRLLARIVVARGGSPTVWEKAPARRAGAEGYAYQVIDPDADDRRDYGCICDASGDPSLIDTLIMRLARGGEIVLAGFYSERVSFAFPMAFIKEAKLRIASEWAPNDMTSVLNLWTEGRLSLEGLITHRRPYSDAPDAYATAFSNPDCLKMVLDWSNAHD